MAVLPLRRWTTNQDDAVQGCGDIISTTYGDILLGELRNRIYVHDFLREPTGTKWASLEGEMLYGYNILPNHGKRSITREEEHDNIVGIWARLAQRGVPRPTDEYADGECGSRDSR